MLRPFYRTIIPGINSLKSDLDYSGYFGNKDKKATQIDKNMFDEKWIKMMASFGLDNFKMNFLFYSPANWSSFGTAHIDKVSGEDVNEFAFNWMIHGDESEMIWYDIPDGVEPTLIPTKFDPTKSIYTWKCTDLIEIDRTVIDDTHYMLVRTDIPHMIVTADEPRMTVSIRFNITNEHVERLIKDGVIY